MPSQAIADPDTAAARRVIDAMMPMRKIVVAAIAMAGVVLAGCQAPGVNLDSVQPNAVDAAMRRAQFDTMCASVTPRVLDRRQETPSRVTDGNVMLVYAIEVAGCDQRRTYVVKCPAVGGACFLAESRAQ